MPRAAKSRWSSAARCPDSPMPSSRAASWSRRFRRTRHSRRSISRPRSRSPRTNCASPRAPGRSGALRRSSPRRRTKSRACSSTASERWSRSIFCGPRIPKRLLPRLRRLFARARLEKEEVNILRGILARIDERLQRTAQGGLNGGDDRIAQRGSSHPRPAATAARRSTARIARLAARRRRCVCRRCASSCAKPPDAMWRSTALLAHGFRAAGAPRIPDARVPGRAPPPLHPSGAPVPVRDADIFRRDALVRGAARYFRGHHPDAPEEDQASVAVDKGFNLQVDSDRRVRLAGAGKALEPFQQSLQDAKRPSSWATAYCATRRMRCSCCCPRSRCC